MADRFDKFTERARQVLTLGQDEAQRFHHNYIGTEHLLLGLCRVEGSVATQVLSNLGVEVERVRTAVEFIIGRGDRAVLGEIGLTPRAKKVIELAVDEARRLNHHYIGTEHLLLGLVREGEGIAAGVLESLGVNLERVHAETERVLDNGVRDAGGTEVGADPSIRVMSPPGRLVAGSPFAQGFSLGMLLSDAARGVISQSASEMQRLSDTTIQPEHMLLALLRPDSGAIEEAFKRVGIVDIGAVRAALLAAMQERRAES